MKSDAERGAEKAPERFEVPTLETDRLVLRRPSVDDAADLFEFCRLPEMSRFTAWEPHRSVQDAVDYLQDVERMQGEDKMLWAIVDREEQKVIGMINLADISRRHRKAALGWELSPAYQRRGLAAEAAAGVFDYAFGELNLHRLEAACSIPNERSAHLMERMGMQYEGTIRDCFFLRGKPVTAKQYAILRPEWIKGA